MADTKLQITLKKLLQDGHQVEVPAHGISMYPLLHPGDKLIVIPKLPDIGDIGIFNNQEILIAHRLIKTDNHYYYFKGDGLIKADTPIEAKNVLGTVIARKRNNKTTSVNHLLFKLFKKLMPKLTPITGRPFYYYGRIHHKLTTLLSGN
ncbi:S24/S26 family peptidase [Carboxylicivirga mesophila]|uniref:S24/S26 family peptidase n=1 Tax=Carboxylicivirga mesophila TaxID=1166478 RepID=A0ABS5K859_9BACT|nr:S24/S26 family peptidase [Carboxylicivirga mesophila]MBS2211144.1 S24/S26 family peptidase [Carboxylicivirga mesophila]